MKSKEIILLPTQVEAWEAEEDITCWIAGIGAGKTRLMSWWVLKECFKYPRNFGTIASSTGPQLKISTVPSFLSEWDEMGVIYKYNEQKNTVTFSNGSWLKFQTLDVPLEQLKGSELGFLVVDEVDACKEGHVITLISRLRRRKTSRKARLIGNSPPPEHWIEKKFLPKDGTPPLGRLMQSTTYENFFLPPDYIKRNELLYPPGTPAHDRFMLGKMGVALPNAVYPQYDPVKHVVSKADLPDREKFVGCLYGMDFGYHHPTVFLKALLDNDDVLWITEEHCESQAGIPTHARHMAKIYSNGPIFGDHDSQERHEYEQLGFTITPAYKDVAVGLEYVRQRFRDGRIKIVREGCPNLIKELPNYQYKENAPKEAVIKIDDDSCDALRYLVCGLDYTSEKSRAMANMIYGALN